ncbi:MAG: gamma-glutamyl-gamma-aminobutyrate hydrolase family protein [Dysgonamonadaceae bacterium]|jgi:microsomal dipeptidase-like Zn-dependent dipeptidase/gamma-glutamyl-gamma-aminobutyrate hydrolase PuuD|nr:gamma-glutamyl-gamma-aminobutyrate hydrolase family protein [Dysgonamonadaceae bacterium]
MLIGLSVNHKDGLSCISDAYVNAVIGAGGSPVLIPLCSSERVLDEILSQIDGLILSGGGDFHPSAFGEELHPKVESFDLERDNYDISLIRKAVAKHIPVLGICRGHQAINVAFGGSLIQDIPSQIIHSEINHNQSESREIATHNVTIRQGSVLHSIVKKDNIPVNSFHHQAIKAVAPGFEPVAHSDDGVIEAIESLENNSVLGVQWHPENMAVAGNEAMADTFRHLVSEADLYKKAKEIHRRIYSIDTHCDTPMHFSKGANIGKKNKNTAVDIPKMQEGMLDATFMVAYLPQKERTKSASEKAFREASAIISQIKSQVEENKNVAEIAYSVDDLKRLKKENKKAIFIGVENGYAIGKDVGNVERLAQMGVQYITLSHNGDNDICDAAVKSNSEHNGLSNFGKEVVREMNRLGMMVDISHTSEKTSFDVLAISQHPVIASHSSVKAICNHPRNLSDKLIKAIAGKGGVIQICLYPGFIKKGGKASFKDAVDHIDYVVKLAGIDHVGIGSDFDGGESLPDLKTVSEMPKITIELLRRGYSEEDIAKIWGGNLVRVMNQIKKKTVKQ